MVCIPCIIAPIALFLWYRFIQPIVLKLWNPWAPQKTVKSAGENKEDEKKSCPFGTKATTEVTEPNEDTIKEAVSKKSD